MEKKKDDVNNVRDRFKKYFENSKQRKKRLWLERKEGSHTKAKTPFLGWMYLPDLILEHIFKFLSYKVRLELETCVSYLGLTRVSYHNELNLI